MLMLLTIHLHRLPNIRFLLIQQSPAYELFFPEEEQPDQFALPVNGYLGDLMGKVLGNKLSMDAAVRWGGDATFLQGCEEGTGLRFIL